MLARNVLNNWKGWLSAVVLLGAIGEIANHCTGVSPGIDSEPSEQSPRSPLMALGIQRGVLRSNSGSSQLMMIGKKA
ncbi:MAG: hypothetical protein AAFY26_13985 [Cyanobacteria bacterium J06638_22]